MGPDRQGAGDQRRPAGRVQGHRATRHGAVDGERDACRAAASGVTRAVKVTLCPNTDGLRLLVTTVVEAAWLTTWTNVALPPPAKIAEPL